MADEVGAQKAFLTWEESADILLIDANHGIARAQRLLAIRYLRGRGVPKDQAVPFIGCNSPHNNIFPWHSAVWASFTKTVLVLR